MKKFLLVRFANFLEKPKPKQPQLPQEATSPSILPSVANEFDYIGQQDAMKLLGVSAPTLRRYSDLGFYRKYQFGAKRTYYKRSELVAFLQNGLPQKKGGAR